MNYIGEIAALGGALLWSVVSFVFTAIQEKINHYQMNIDRMVVAAILMLLTLVFLGVTLSISSFQFTLLFVSGIIGLVIGDSALFVAFREIGPRITNLLIAFNPALSALIAYFVLGETLTALAIGGIAITITGIVIVIAEKPKHKSIYKVNTKGVIYALIGTTGQAIGLVITKLAFNAGDLHELTATFYRLLAGIIFMLPIAFIMKKYTNPVKLYPPIKKYLWLVIIAAVIGPYLGITFSFVAIVNTKVGIASTLLSTSPILVLPIYRFWYKEKLSMISIVGAFVAVFGVALLFL